MSTDRATIINQTKKWINSVVIDCNFCPFAAKAMLKRDINFIIEPSNEITTTLQTLKTELHQLDRDPEIETSFIILSEGFIDFNDYLNLVEASENVLVEEDYEGIYQVASFHPDYCFDGAPKNDPANYTNRSIYPMLHILREDSVTKALSLYPHPEKIPQNNIKFAREKGLAYMQALRLACL
ncbi:MAG: hypothetical protein K0R26_649 [Bacteroidota bacterium]|jgi:hypothetical protein|nr:hypothetical protein [Bacteroidota bacterium]